MGLAAVHAIYPGWVMLHPAGRRRVQGRSSSHRDQAILAHGEMGKMFPMRIARLPYAHLVD